MFHSIEMRLDRNISKFGIGKYALVLLRQLPVAAPTFLSVLEDHGIEPEVIDFGNTPDSEFFVIRLRDKFAAPALAAYAMAAWEWDQEWATEVLNLAKKAAEHSNKTTPS